MSKLWIKFKTYSAVKVSIEDCQDVDDFLKACKKELSQKLGSYDVDQLSLSTTEGGSPLEPDDPFHLQTLQRLLSLSVLKNNPLFLKGAAHLPSPI